MSKKLIIKNDELSNCPLCGSDKISTVISGKDFETGSGDYRIDFCDLCGIYFTNPRPIEEDIKKLYEGRETSDFVKPNILFNKLREISINLEIESILSKFSDDLTVLDYGCGDGFFSLQLSKNKKCSKVIAMDFHSSPPFYIKNSENIKYYSYSENVLKEEIYDIVFCRNVLEHVVNPVQTVSEMWKYLKSGSGVLILEIPNFMSIWKKIFGKYYFGLYLPRHLYHFNMENINLVLKRFFKINVYYSHTPVIGRSIGYLLGNSLSNISLIGLLLFPFQVLLDKFCGSSSLLRVFAYKD